VRTLRHGVKPNGKPAIIMPAHEYYVMSDEDLGAIIAYVKSAPPADNTIPAPDVRLLGRILFATGQLNLIPAEMIPHDAPRPKAPQIAETIEYGKYMATTCTGCHRASFSGGPIIGSPPGSKPAANLTPAGELSGWTFEQFETALRTGRLPGGRQMDNVEIGRFWSGE
jgi:cytochrome c553